MTAKEAYNLAKQRQREADRALAEADGRDACRRKWLSCGTTWTRRRQSDAGRLTRSWTRMSPESSTRNNRLAAGAEP